MGKYSRQMRPLIMNNCLDQIEQIAYIKKFSIVLSTFLSFTATYFLYLYTFLKKKKKKKLLELTSHIIRS